MENPNDDYTQNNRVTLVRGGKQYFDHLVQLISSAEETIHLQTYIFADDDTGQLVIDELQKARQRDVKIFLMVDGYASQGLAKGFIQDIKKSGIRFKQFEPLFKSRRFYLGRRLHHKLCVADNRYALVGGVNIANHYNDIDKPAWLDFAINVEGEVVQELLVLCQKTWNGFQPLSRIPRQRSVPFFIIPPDVRSHVRMRRNDWVRRKNQIFASYLEMFKTAQSDILILSSYFLPGSLFRKEMRNAIKRGVKITVILAGVSDIKMAKLAERYVYEWLLEKDITIYEYNETILHGKLAICDSQWITLGSFNVNDISTYASVELNLDVADPRFAREVHEYLNQNIITRSMLVSNEYMAGNSSLWQRLLRWVSFSITRFLVFFFTFYFKQVKETDAA
jgi:cardiolipin synthase